MKKKSLKLVAKPKRKSEVDRLFDNLSFVYSEKRSCLPKKDLINSKNESIKSLKTGGNKRLRLDSKLHCERLIDSDSESSSKITEGCSLIHQQSDKDKEGVRLFKSVKGDKVFSKKKKRKSEIDSLFDNLSFIYSEKKTCLSKVDKQARKNSIANLVEDKNEKRWSLYNHHHDNEIFHNDLHGLPMIINDQSQNNKVSNRNSEYNISFECVKKDSLSTHKNKESLQISALKSVKKKNFKTGDVVICYFKNFGWWFAKIIHHNERVAEGNCWVYSFGDHKKLMVPLHSLRHHYDFSRKFNQTKMKKPLYKKAVREFLLELTEQHGFKIKLGQKGYLNKLIEWGFNGFVEHGSVDKNNNESSIDTNNESSIDTNNKESSIDTNNKESSIDTNNESSKIMIKDRSTENKDVSLKNVCSSTLFEDSEEYLHCDQHKSKVSFKNSTEDSVLDSEQSLCNETNNSTILKSSIANHTTQTKYLECEDIDSYDVHDWFSENLDHGKAGSGSEKQKKVIQKSSDKILFNIEDYNETCIDFSINSEYAAFCSNSTHNETAFCSISTPNEIGCENTIFLKKSLDKTTKNKALYKDGIKLDLTLLNEQTPKRRCSIKNKTPTSVSPKIATGSSIAIGKKLNCVIGNKHSCNKNLETLDRSDFFPIKIGDLVLGKLKGYDWWFGIVVSHRVIRQRPAANDCHWIRWYGDHKISEVHLQNIELLKSFSSRYLPSKMQGLYLRAIKELLEEAARRCSKTDLPEDEKRLDVLVDWALNGFQPYGFEQLLIEETLEVVNTLIPEGSETDGLTHNDGEPLPYPILSEDVKALFDKAANGNLDLNKICLGCGDLKCITEHPLFIGGLCKECKESFMETAYLYDEDGSQMYCSICSDGREIILCDVPGCYRSYCSVCLDMFCGVGYARSISVGVDWHCFMCTGEKVRLIQRRDDWQQRLKNIFSVNNEGYPLPFFYDPVDFKDRPPLRVLSLFDGLSTGYLALSELGLDILLYQASEIDPLAIKVSKVHHNMRVEQIGDVQKISKQDIENWGPFDLVIGGSPCDELSIANPFRKGIYEGTGQLFFEFYRILEYCKPQPLTSRPFFWLFENVVGMRYTDRAVISRFLQCHPVIINAKEVSAQQRTRYFWGNLPGMNRAMCPLPSDRLKLQQCLEKDCGRVAKFDKVRCITTSQNSLKQTKAAMLPVKWTISRNSQLDDGLWLTEIERIFGFPDHYTDVANMGQRDRQKLLGKSWSVPVLRHLLAPLRNYFRSKVYIDDNSLS